MEQYPTEAPKKKFPFGLVVFLLAAAFVGGRVYLDNVGFAKGQEYMAVGDCQSASTEFTKLIEAFRVIDMGHSTRAQIALDECAYYQEGMSNIDSDPGLALIAFADQALSYPISVVTPFAVENAQSILASDDVSDYLTPNVCNNYTTFKELNFFADQQVDAPWFLINCALNAYKDYDDENATNYFGLLQTEFPNSEYLTEFEDEMAESYYTYFSESGAGIIEAPAASGSTGGDHVEVVIQNDSPERLRIMFVGPETTIEEIGACADCIEYFGEGPTYCPAQGPIGRYTLPAGTYNVVVESISDDMVTPWVGNWDLSSGSIYDQCFFIVTGN